LASAHQCHSLLSSGKAEAHGTACINYQTRTRTAHPQVLQAAVRGEYTIMAMCVSLCCCAAVWQVHEQTSIALLEMGDTKAAVPLIKAVLLQFPENSIRARRLQVGQLRTALLAGVES
jgi:hypothetical protein